jgi:hypothetical protein
MKSTIGFTTLAIIASLAFSDIAKAATLNGGFEEGFTGWETIGNYQIETSSFGSGPVQGSSQAFLSTAFNEVVGLDAKGNEVTGGNAVPISFISGYPNLEEFLGISTFFGDTSLSDVATAEPIEGSAIRQTFTAVAGQTLSFSWNFLTNESVGQAAVDDFTYPDFNDFAFALLQSGSSSQLISLADTISNFSNSSTVFDNETGFQSFSYTIPTTGTYNLAIGVVDVGEPTRISGLLVDNAQVVPEGSSVLGIVCFGVGGTGLMLKRRKKKTRLIS